MRLKNFAAAMAAFGVIAVAGSAQAGIEQEFADFCLKTSTITEAQAAARAAGFVAAPEALAAKAKALSPIGEVLWRAIDGGALIFISANAERSSADGARSMNADVCMLASQPPQPDLAKVVMPLVGVGELQAMGRMEGFVYERRGNKRVRLDTTNREKVTQSARAGTLHLVSVTEQAGFSGVMLMKPAISGQ